MNLTFTHLPRDIESVGFVEREKCGGKTVANRCGRDFFYYALNYYRPDLHNAARGNPMDIEKRGLFGLPIPSWLVWTFLSFCKVPRYFASLELELLINNRRVKTFPQFVKAALSKAYPADDAMRMIERAVDSGIVSGIDISIALGGLIDHVMFVYGYDDNNLYVFDTHRVRGLEYEKLTQDGDLRYIMRLPKSVIRRRWSRFNRVWVVRSLS